MAVRRKKSQRHKWTVSEKLEVVQARQRGLTLAELWALYRANCHGVAKWMKAYEDQGIAGLEQTASVRGGPGDGGGGRQGARGALPAWVPGVGAGNGAQALAEKWTGSDSSGAPPSEQARRGSLFRAGESQRTMADRHHEFYDQGAVPGVLDRIHGRPQPVSGGLGVVSVPDIGQRAGSVPCGDRETRDAERGVERQRAAVLHVERQEPVHDAALEAGDPAYSKSAVSSADVRQDRVVLAEPVPGMPVAVAFGVV